MTVLSPKMSPNLNDGDDTQDVTVIVMLSKLTPYLNDTDVTASRKHVTFVVSIQEEVLNCAICYRDCLDDADL